MNNNLPHKEYNINDNPINDNPINEQSDNDEEIYYHMYECNKCGFKTRNDNPDCSSCNKSFCMLAKDITQKELDKYYQELYENEDDDDDDFQDCNPTICTKDCACDTCNTPSSNK